MLAASLSVLDSPTTTEPSALTPFAADWPFDPMKLPRLTIPPLEVQRNACVAEIVPPPKIDSLLFVSVDPTTTDPSALTPFANELPLGVAKLPRSVGPADVQTKAC